MPKVVDHDQRRRHIAEAVWRLAGARGLDTLGLRDIAAEAGVSLGSVQHYFTSKEHLLLDACQRMVDLAGEGAADLAAASVAPGSPREQLRAVAVQTLPLTDGQKLGTRVWYAFVGRAVVDEQIAAVIRRAWDEVHAHVADQLRLPAADGSARADLDADAAATELLGLIDGLVQHVLVGHLGADRALALVDAHLDRLLCASTASPS